ncbi:C-C chemokine receptor type 9 [Trichoplax sp. H2]|nr:C-C chemokine receptor type 9 [Trichoplax sp. H2]|eukprot:RDD44065.1 C-C chemokine receptor type 9 [Trichoplax sp. H2]
MTTKLPYQSNENISQHSNASVTLRDILQSYSLFAILGIIVGCIGVLFQTWVIITVWLTKRMHVASFILMGNLAVADLMYSISLFFYGVLQLMYITTSPILMVMVVNCYISFFLIGMNYGTSIITLTFISYDRYYKIISPLSSECRSKRRIVYYLITSWLLGILVGMLLALTTGVDPNFPFTCDVSYNVGLAGTQAIYTFLTLAFYVIPVIVILICYSKLIHRLRHLSRPGINNKEQLRNHNESKHSAIRLIIAVTAIFIIVTWPYWVSSLGLVYTGDTFVSLRASGKILEASIAGFASVPIMLTAFIYPPLYLIFNKSLRHDMLAILRCPWHASLPLLMRRTYSSKNQIIIMTRTASTTNTNIKYVSHDKASISLLNA